jgi:hypothetical protein
VIVDRVLRIVTLMLVVSLALTACDFAGDEEGHPVPLPEGDPWPAESDVAVGDEAPVYLMIDFTVDRGFRSGFIEVDVDGKPVVSGLGFDRPEEHCNWYGPYILNLARGAHRLNATVSAGPVAEDPTPGETIDVIDETFDVSGETTLFVHYVDPSSDSNLAAGRLDAFTHSGRPGCA